MVPAGEYVRSCGVLLDGIPCPSDELVGRRGSSLDREVQTGIYESENSSVLLLPLHIWKETDPILRRSYDLDRHKKATAATDSDHHSIYTFHKAASGLYIAVFNSAAVKQSVRRCSPKPRRHGRRESTKRTVLATD